MRQRAVPRVLRIRSSWLLAACGLIVASGSPEAAENPFQKGAPVLSTEDVRSIVAALLADHDETPPASSTGPSAADAAEALSLSETSDAPEGNALIGCVNGLAVLRSGGLGLIYEAGSPHCKGTP